MASSVSTTPAAAVPAHLPHLDGLRALAALYVVVHHAYCEVGPDRAGVLHPIVRAATAWLDHGQNAVAVFIVLSGFCLMLPIVRAGARPLDGVDFLRRRARRILPPYYAALLLTLLLIALVPGLREPSGVRMDESRPAFRPDVLLSHALLVHNVHGDWLYAIDPPMWSVAVEWQIYFLFPLALLPAWRRRGVGGALLVALALAAAARSIAWLSGSAGFSWPCPWFIVLFALGMAAAALSEGRDATTISRREVVAWQCAGVLGVIAYVAWQLMPEGSMTRHRAPADLLVGFASACWLVALAIAFRREQQRDPASVLLQLASARWLVVVGGFSYSLYLVHFPLLSLCHLPLLSMGLGPHARLVALVSIAVPLCVAVSYFFYLAFERPFLRTGNVGKKEPAPGREAPVALAA